MSQHFPIFIDIATVPPLVIGTGPAITAKIRLLRKFAPVVDLVTDGVFLQDELPDPGVRQLSGVRPAESQPLFQGRPLIVIDTGDDKLDGRLATTARAIGVPVNVPDRPALCSFYFGSLVDRDPVTIAISTSGMAPVLAQRLRARLEDMLTPGYGRIAWYLWRLRDRLRHLSPAQRRETQHRIIDGAVARFVVAGENEIADKLAVRMIADAGHDAPRKIHLLDSSSGAPNRLGARGIEAIRNADFVIYGADESPAILDLVRREAVLRQVPWLDSGALPALVTSDVESMMFAGCRGVILVQQSAAIAAMAQAFARTDIIVEIMPAAGPPCSGAPVPILMDDRQRNGAISPGRGQ